MPNKVPPLPDESAPAGCLVATVQTITRIASSTSHYIRFIGGGDLRFAFTDKGELLELSGHRINFSVTESGEVDVSPYFGV